MSNLAHTPPPSAASPVDVPVLLGRDAPVARVLRGGLGFVAFSAELLLAGPGASAPALGGFRKAGGPSPVERLVWRPSHLETLGDDATGDWTLHLEHRELGAAPGARPRVDLVVDGRLLEEHEVEIDHDAADGVMALGFRLDAPIRRVHVAEDQDDPVLVLIETEA